MPIDAAQAVPGVTVSIARDPSLVRTVRLVAAAVARRSGADEEFVEEVRLAVGEACALLMGQEVDLATPEPVSVFMSLDDRLSVEVAATVPGATPMTDELDYVEPWALLRGLVDDFSIARDGSVTTVSMSWPAV